MLMRLRRRSGDDLRPMTTELGWITPISLMASRASFAIGITVYCLLRPEHRAADAPGCPARRGGSILRPSRVDAAL